jgi:hypothetical protein
MSDRSLKILVGVLAALVVAWAAVRLLGGRGAAPEPVPFDLESAAALDIDSIVIAAADDTVRLRASDGWTVNGHEAALETGESLRRALEGARIEQLVSRNPENHMRLGVTRTAGRRVTVYAGGTAELSLIIGQGRRGFDQAYVRREGDDEVYTLEGSLVSLANRAVDDWRDKDIVLVNRDEVGRVAFTYSDESFTLVRDSTGWRFEPEGGAANAAQVDGILMVFASLRAIGFAADSVTEALVWEPPSARVQLFGPGDAPYGDIVFLERADDVGYYVRRAGSPVVYEISSYTGDQILKRAADLAAVADGAN